MTFVNPHIILLSLAVLVVSAAAAAKMGFEAWLDYRALRRHLRRRARRAVARLAREEQS